LTTISGFVSAEAIRLELHKDWTLNERKRLCASRGEYLRAAARSETEKPCYHLVPHVGCSVIVRHPSSIHSGRSRAAHGNMHHLLDKESGEGGLEMARPLSTTLSFFGDGYLDQLASSDFRFDVGIKRIWGNDRRSRALPADRGWGGLVRPAIWFIKLSPYGVPPQRSPMKMAEDGYNQFDLQQWSPCSRFLGLRSRHLKRGEGSVPDFRIPPLSRPWTPRSLHLADTRPFLI
jgi:hypothetical protein